MNKQMRMCGAAILAVSVFSACQIDGLSVPFGVAAEQAVAVDGVLVSSPDAFEQAVAAAQPGDTIVLANGVWADFDILFEATGTAEAPIELVAQTPGEVILSGQSSLRLAGEHLIVSGLVFKDGYTPRNEVISFRKDSDTLAYHSRVTETVIDGYSNPDRTKRDLWVGLYGQNNVFDSNHLSGKQNAGPTLAVRLNSEASQNNNHRIANNYFGPRPVFGSNGGETMRIGTSHFSLTESNTVVENNFFDRCSGEVEIVSNKSGGNVFRGNTFYASRGTLTLRHGNGTLVENNLFDGAGAPYTGGVRVINAKQTIRNNYFTNLTGNRFSGALVVMNGVPDSPINRYHQVDGAIIEANVFDQVAAIELGEGSDAERTAVPINSSFQNNVVSGRAGANPFTLYDDMTGISFSDNIAAADVPEALKSGFTAGADAATEKSASDFGVARSETGTDWYPKPTEASPFEQSREIVLEPGTDVLWEALATAQPGDHYVLTSGRYHESKQITLEVPVTVRAAAAAEPVVSFERPNLFVLTGNSALALDGLRVTGEAAPDGSGNSFISTSSVKGAGNHLLSLNNIEVDEFDVNRGFSVVSAAKGSFFDRIDVSGSTFENISGTVFKLDAETDDYGIYNAEYLTITDSAFDTIGGPIAAVYRGGRDESTFGPHVEVNGSRFVEVGKGTGPLMVLHGIQRGHFIGNKIENAQPVAVTFTTGLPVFTMEDNSVNGSGRDEFSDISDLRNRK